MDLTIREAADRVGVPPSTLRYWEARGLLNPGRRAGGRRYATADLRRAALLRLARDLDLPLGTAVVVLDGAPEERSALVAAEVERLEALLERGQGALELLRNARDCPHEHPARQCPELTTALDRVLEGGDPRPQATPSSPGR